MSVFSIGVLSAVFQFGWLIVAVIALAFLVRLYVRTRMTGFVWLLVAVVVWPAVARFTAFFIPMLLSARYSSATSAAEFTVIVYGLESLLGAVFLLIAAITLDRQLSAVAAAPTTASPLPKYYGG